jgi:NADH-quinone oxidoreductase chain G
MDNNFVYINKKKIEVRDWSLTIFQLSETLNIKIPRFCYHEKLSIAGNCRMCLIEVESSVKPIIACATSLSKGMSILTNSALVKKARENVLEFLLINHPLDCPICDQGGECDLQDQSLIYGSDKGRFTEIKRSVEDKDFGPLVKTVMTRCIHCTRCVRYMDEVAGFNGLGTMGRGRDTEISTYLGIGLDSEISGNVIDLCPVGALTSKPYAFTGRPWELTSVESIDILDSLCSNIRIDVKGSEIMRILPKKNELVNEEWITDKIRFSYDGLKIERLAFPLIKNTSGFISCSWHFTYSLLSFKLQEFIMESNSNISSEFQNSERFLKEMKAHILSNENIIAKQKKNKTQKSLFFFVGNLVDAHTIQLFRYLYDLIPAMGQFKIDSNKNCSHDLRSNYLMNQSLNSLEKSDLFLLVGTNLKDKLPLMNTRIRKQLISNLNSKVLYCGISNKFNIDIVHFGLTNKVLLRLIKGKLPLTSILQKNKKITVLNDSDSNISYLNHLLKNDVNISNLFQTVTEVSSCELGINNEISANMLNTTIAKFIFLLNYNKNTHINKQPGDFIVYQGHHADENAMIADLVLPGCAFTEENAPYINILGSTQWTRAAVEPIGLSAKNSTILLRLIFMLSEHLRVANFISKKDIDKTLLYSYFSDKMPGLYSTKLISGSPQIMNTELPQVTNWVYYNTAFRYNSNINYFETDIISLYSTTMRKLSKIRGIKSYN